MSGVWESLFREEKQDWVAWTTGKFACTANFLIEVPCLLLAVMSASAVTAWEFLAAQARVISDLLLLDEWWGLEHTILVGYMGMNLIMFGKRKRGDWFNVFCQLNCILQALLTAGCFVWMAAGVQGGVVFGGKLFFPSVALLSMAFQVSRIFSHVTDKEMHGYGPQQETKDSRYEKVMGYFGIGSCEFMVLLFSFATFGFPSLGGDVLPWFSLFPMLANFKRSNDYFQPEALPCDDGVAMTDITDNGNATKITEAAEPEEKSAPVEEAPEKISAAEETTEKVEEPVIAAEPAKPSALCVALGGVISVLCKTMLSLKASTIRLAQGVLGLPWECIFTTITSIGTSLAITFAYWTLTEDLIVVMMPVVCHLIPFIAGKAQGKGWLTERGNCLAMELSHLSAAASQYYIFRTYISLPF